VADICLVNTCTVTHGADVKSRNMVRRLARENPGALLIVTGCSAEAFADFEGVTTIVPNKDKENLLKIIFPEETFPEFSIRGFEGHTRAFIKIQDGCNSFCSYCIIPYVRGRSRSRSMDAVVKEVQGLVANGYKEFVITGINVGDYDGGPEKCSLANLIATIDDIPGVGRIRVSSIGPDDVDDALVDVILGGRHTCPSMHLVLQSGSNAILKKMNRKYTRQMFLDVVERFSCRYSDFTFTTDVILGFPGESNKDFQETLDIIRQVQFAKVHQFPYSVRPGTRAARWSERVPEHVIRHRKEELLEVAQRAAKNLRQRYVGKRMAVLTEDVDPKRPHGISGHTDNFLEVWIQNDSVKPNEFVTVECSANTSEGLECVLKSLNG